MTIAHRPFPRQPSGASQASGLRFSSVDFVIFMLFATYGPSFSFVGQLRILEALLIAYVILRAGSLLRTLRGPALTLFLLFIVSGITHVIVGTYHEAPQNAIIARSGTYFVLALIFFAVLDITRNDPRKLLIVVAGYCCSYVFILFVGSSTSANYAAFPWRLGLGFAVTLGVCVYFAARPHLQSLAPVALVFMGGIHVMASARAMGAIALLVAGAVFLGQMRKTSRPLPFSLLTVAVCILIGVLAGTVGLEGIILLSEMGVLPTELSDKMDKQLSHSAGLLAAARPDTMTAIYAIQASPLLGYGPGVVDPEVFLLYAYLSAEGLVSAELDYEFLALHTFEKDWELGTPSHSHVFGAWADAGVFASFCWFFVAGLSFYVAVRSFLFRNAWAPMYLFIAIATLWDVFFSPGPIRMDMAVRLLILFFAVHHLRIASRPA